MVQLVQSVLGERHGQRHLTPNCCAMNYATQLPTSPTTSKSGFNSCQSANSHSRNSGEMIEVRTSDANPEVLILKTRTSQIICNDRLGKKVRVKCKYVP